MYTLELTIEQVKTLLEALEIADSWQRSTTSKFTVLMKFLKKSSTSN